MNIGNEPKEYGEELILNLSQCDVSTFSRDNVERYLKGICELIDMKRHGDPLFWVDDSEHAHLNGVSAIQFIETSTIVVHALHMLECVFINVFSCKKFDSKIAEDFTKKFFRAKSVSSQLMKRTYIE